MLALDLFIELTAKIRFVSKLMLEPCMQLRLRMLFKMIDLIRWTI